MQLQEGARDRDGSPCWVIYDPPANRFFKIGWLEFELLARWDADNADELVGAVNAETSLRPALDDLQRFLLFLQQNQLLKDPSPLGAATLQMLAARQKTALSTWLIHNYLFFRIPLLKPDAMLNRIYSLISPLFNGATLVLFMSLFLTGIYLVLRQWDLFVSTFVNTLTPAGMFGYLLMLIIAKILHELGHALMAKHYGVRVPRMGMAFLVMFPVLYTDTCESWFLADHRKRLMISSAGILAEAALAALALFLWGVSGNGLLRDLFYFLTVVSLTRSLLVNSSPFLKFDGYYILSDLLDMPNLQQRAFALTRHKIRSLIFGYQQPPPEHFSARMTRFLVVYSWATWLYRLVVFLGIAFAVYQFFFKPLGILLMLIEIWYFILLPVAREITAWREVAIMTSGRRKLALGVLVISMMIAMLVPVQSQVAVPAYLAARDRLQIFAPFPARIVQVAANGSQVKKGDILFRLDADESRFQASQAALQATELRDRVRRLAASEKGREQAAAWSAEASEREHASVTQHAEQRRLIIKAEFDGVLSDVDEGLKPGWHVTSRDPMGTLINPFSAEIEAFVSEQDLDRIKPGNHVIFWAKEPGIASVTGRVVEIDRNRLAVLPSAALADKNGGEIPTVNSAERHLVPTESIYRIRITPDHHSKIERMQFGHAVIEGERTSLAGRFIRHAASVLVRESGF